MGMKETNPIIKPESRTPAVFPTNLAIDLVDRSQSTTFALLQEVRAEVRAAIDGTIELADKLGGAVVRVARKTTARVDEATAATLTDVERWLGGALDRVRKTTRAAGDLAATAVGQQAASSAA
jgi:hypothetical protein